MHIAICFPFQQKVDYLLLKIKIICRVRGEVVGDKSAKKLHTFSNLSKIDLLIYKYPYRQKYLTLKKSINTSLLWIMNPNCPLCK